LLEACKLHSKLFLTAEQASIPGFDLCIEPLDVVVENLLPGIYDSIRADKAVHLPDEPLGNSVRTGKKVLDARTIPADGLCKFRFIRQLQCAIVVDLDSEIGKPRWGALWLTSDLCGYVVAQVIPKGPECSIVAEVSTRIFLNVDRRLFRNEREDVVVLCDE